MLKAIEILLKVCTIDPKIKVLTLHANTSARTFGLHFNLWWSSVKHAHKTKTYRIAFAIIIMLMYDENLKTLPSNARH